MFSKGGARMKGEELMTEYEFNVFKPTVDGRKVIFSRTIDNLVQLQTLIYAAHLLMECLGLKFQIEVIPKERKE